MHIYKLHIFVQIYLVIALIDISAQICYSINRKKNNGSFEERQLLKACAGDYRTYTTDESAPYGVIIPV